MSEDVDVDEALAMVRTGSAIRVQATDRCYLISEAYHGNQYSVLCLNQHRAFCFREQESERQVRRRIERGDEWIVDDVDELIPARFREPVEGER